MLGSTVYSPLVPSAAAAAAARPPDHPPSVHPSTVLLHPHLLHFLETEELVRLGSLSKTYAHIIKTDNTVGYWPAMCASLTGKRGIYSPHVTKNARAYFFEELWKSNSKWKLDSAVQDFKIRVCTRFRPGEKSQSKFALPLHQFLKVRRQQLKEAKDGEAEVFVGEDIPEHMLDALLGTLMHQPVQLQHSGRILDRSVAVACVLRGGKDPFTGATLTMESLTPLPDLTAEIADFKIKQANVDISVGEKDVLRLVEEVDPALLEALVAVEQLNCAARRAHIDGLDSQRNRAALLEPVNEALLQEDTPEVEDEATDNSLQYFSRILTQDVHETIEAADNSVESGGEGEKRAHDDKFLSRWGKVKNDTARIIDVSGSNACVTMNVPGTGVRPFYFNKVFPSQERQVSIYNKYARDIVVAAVNGQNGCLLCYGQTSSGKTFTMFGPPGQEDGGASLHDIEAQHKRLYGEVKVDPVTELQDICSTNQSIGIVLRSCAEILRAKKLFQRRGEVELNISAQYVEVYSEVVTDLMSGSRVSVRRANGDLHGATDVPIHDLPDIVEVLKVGNQRKHFAATAMNDRSSRSHTALVLTLSQTSAETGTHLKSALYLVDLAGSERVKKSGAEGVQMREARAINSSLLVLGKVINRLSRSEYHVPYYESQLTTLLKGAFGGNSRTGVIVTCRSDDQHHGDETLQSLRFGELCGMISNSTRLAASSVESVLEALDKSIEQVTQQIDAMVQGGRHNIPSFQSLNIKLSELKSKRTSIAEAQSRQSSSMSVANGGENNERH